MKLGEKFGKAEEQAQAMVYEKDGEGESQIQREFRNKFPDLFRSDEVIEVLEQITKVRSRASESSSRNKAIKMVYDGTGKEL